MTPCPHGDQCPNLARVRDLEFQLSRARKGQGSHNGNTDLTEDDIRAIDRLRAEGWSQRKRARHFHVGQSTIADIDSRKSWAHVPLDPGEDLR